MRLYPNIILLIFNAFIMNSFAQQVQLEGLDVRTVMIDDTVTVHDYIDRMNKESFEQKIKSKVKFNVKKNGKSKINTRELYNSEGKIIYKVDYSWNKGRDSATVHYEYDSLNRLVYAVEHNSIFGKDHKGTTIRFVYDKTGRVIECRTENNLVLFTYNPFGRKDSIELIKYSHLCYPNIRRPKTHVYDTISRKYYFTYDNKKKLKGILNVKGDTLIKYHYEKNGNLIRRNEYDEFIDEVNLENGLIVKSSFFEIQYSSQDTVGFEYCKYKYVNNKIESSVCSTDMEFKFNYAIQYIYNEKGLLIETIYKDEKQNIYRRTKYEYEYY